MQQSTITIKVALDENRVPQAITWDATENDTETPKQAKAMVISFWDGAEKTALRVDLWTKDMMVDEMADFYYQIFMTMADTYRRATQHEELADQMKKFAHEFYDGFRKMQLKENKL